VKVARKRPNEGSGEGTEEKRQRNGRGYGLRQQAGPRESRVMTWGGSEGEIWTFAVGRR